MPRALLAVFVALLAFAAPALAAFPSGRTEAQGYRTLADYDQELHGLAAANPGFVREFTLPHKTAQGRALHGIEITTDVAARDGKPVFLMLGLHHANEWPSGELTLEWAYELVNGAVAGDPRAKALVDGERTIIVPVVNPDGFNYSRAGVGTSAEDHRKNCNGGTCTPSGGVDVNRNYGDLWGGTGASPSPADGTYRGPSPFSEPEAQDIRELMSSHQVVAMITNHTAGRLILRQPGLRSEPVTPDEQLYQSLGASMAAANGYTNEFSWQLYDHVGTSDGWLYYATGGLGYVFESMTGPHPAYSQVIAEYGSGASGDREAFYRAGQAAMTAADHAVLRGSAPAGAILRLTKSFDNRTTVGPATHEVLDSTMAVPSSGQFAWHVNPSGRPLAPDERWTLTCERPEGNAQTTQQVSVARGQSVDLGTLPCAPPAPPAKPKPAIRAHLSARRGARWYRAQLAGSFSEIDPGPGARNCAGSVTVQLFAAGGRVRQRKAPLDAACGFDRSFKFGRSSLPKRARKKGAKHMRAVVRWNGNDVLAAASKTARARVKRH